MFGIGAGEIDVVIPGVIFSHGQIIEGQVLLTVKKPTKAKGVFVKLYVEQKYRERHSDGKMHDATRILYDFSVPLDGEKEYPPTPAPVSYPFRIKVPEGAGVSAMGSLPQINLGPFSIDLGGISGSSPVRWYLEGYLDVPFGLDVRKKIQLNI